MPLGYQELAKTLPRDRRLWKYNNNAMQPYREQLDAMSRNYLMRCKPEELGEFKQLLAQETRFREALYGSGTKKLTVLKTTPTTSYMNCMPGWVTVF